MSVAPPQARTVPRPVYCVTGHAYRDLATAEAVCRGRFTHAGATRELGLPPDWLAADVPSDEEWRIEWTKFYYGLDLAHAFATTGEPRFLDAWSLLVTSWIEAIPLGADPPDVTARRVQNWIYAWSRFAAAPAFPGLDPALAERILGSLREQVESIRDNLTEGDWRNHRVLELYALMVAALAFPSELDPGGELLDISTRGLHRCLRAGTWPDGVHREQSTHYHLLVLRSFLGARENARRFGVELPAGYDERLAAACEFGAHCHRPDGPASALSDADSVAYAELLDLAGGLLDRPDLTWVATRGSRGRAPRVRSASFPHGGYFTQRSGWGEDDTPYGDEAYLVFDCGPLGEGGHGHYDALSVEIAAGGRALVVDPGRYTYEEGARENLRHWFKGTAAHNTVCVDGRDQTPYRRGRPRGRAAAAEFLGRSRTPGLDVLRGRVLSPCYEAVHSRAVAMVRGEYWLIEDHVAGERPHRYDVRFHLAPEAHGRVQLHGPAVRAPGLALVFARGLDVRVEGGWVAPLYGVKEPAPVVSAAADGVAELRCVTLVAPLRDGEPLPALSVVGPGRAVVERAGRVPERVEWEAA
jgi:hypothetical protein